MCDTPLLGTLRLNSSRYPVSVVDRSFASIRRMLSTSVSSFGTRGRTTVGITVSITLPENLFVEIAHRIKHKYFKYHQAPDATIHYRQS
jgi:hypothetical protein